MSNFIAVLSAGLKKDKDGKWHSTDIDGIDERWGAPGGYLRVLAASYLYKDNPNQYVVACSGKGWDITEKNRPLLCEVIKRELIDLGVSAEYIIEDKISNKTFEQLNMLQKVIKGKDVNQLIIISNIYHLPRVQAMIENIPELKELKELFKINDLKLEAAEDIIMENNSQDWQEKIEFAYKSERMQKIIKSEREGVNDIKKRKYKYK